MKKLFYIGLFLVFGLASIKPSYAMSFYKNKQPKQTEKLSSHKSNVVVRLVQCIVFFLIVISLPKIVQKCQLGVDLLVFVADYGDHCQEKDKCKANLSGERGILGFFEGIGSAPKNIYNELKLRARASDLDKRLKS